MSAQSPVRLFHPNPHVETCKRCLKVTRECGTVGRSGVRQDVRDSLEEYLFLRGEDQINKELSLTTPGLAIVFARLDPHRTEVCFMPNYAINDGEVQEEYKSLCDECEKENPA